MIEVLPWRRRLEPLPPTPASPIPHVERGLLRSLLQNLERERHSRVIVYWTTGWASIAHAVMVPLYDQLARIGRQERIDLYLYTYGGDGTASWRIVTLLREFCDHLGLLVPEMAQSAGTLIALGADEIVMSPLGTLGPIDPSRTHPLLPRPEGGAEAEPISVQDMRHAMQFIREAAGDDSPYTPEAMAQIFTALFDKIHPLAIGAIEQTYVLTKLIATRCLSTHMDPVAEAATIRQIADTMCDDFKSHYYKIGRREARSLGLKVVDAPLEVEKAMMELWKFYVQRPVRPIDAPPQVPGSRQTQVIAWLDSLDMTACVVGQYLVQPDGRLQYVDDDWVTY